MTDNTASLLDMDLDDLADIPEFVTPPAGAYQVTILSAEEKKVSENDGVEIKFRIDSTLELADPASVAVKDGTETSIFYSFGNEYGVGGLKAFMAPIKVATGLRTGRENMAALPGMILMLVTKTRHGKKGSDNEDKVYLGIIRVEVL